MIKRGDIRTKDRKIGAGKYQAQAGIILTHEVTYASLPEQSKSLRAKVAKDFAATMVWEAIYGDIGAELGAIREAVYMLECKDRTEQFNILERIEALRRKLR